MSLIKKYGIYINGEWKENTENSFYSINPYNQEKWAKITQASESDVRESIKVANTAFEQWKNVSGRKRAELIYNFAKLLEENIERLAILETTDNGKILRETRNQMKFAARNYLFFAGYADKINGNTIPLDNNSLFNYTKRIPLGVVALITSWNSPISILTNKLAPALASGNTVIIKPSEYASVTTLELVKLIEEAGFPKGVVNVITGDSKVGKWLTESKGINKVSFTGGTETGKIIAKNTSNTLTKNTLELGGKSPNIVFEDANINAAVTGAVAGIFGAAGQTCIAGSRLFIQKTIYDEFLQKLVAKASKIKLGNPLKKDTEMGPIANKAQYKKIKDSIINAVQEGLNMALGYKDFENQLESLEETGYFIPPTIFTNVENKSNIAQNEIFGPVLSVTPFNNVSDVIEMANNTDFGLAAGIWTNDLQRAHNLADEIDAGTIWINTYRSTAAQAPFGGFKNSGYGKERGKEALLEYTKIKNIMVNLSKEVRDPFTIEN